MPNMLAELDDFEKRLKAAQNVSSENNLNRWMYKVDWNWMDEHRAKYMRNNSHISKPELSNSKEATLNTEDKEMERSKHIDEIPEISKEFTKEDEHLPTQKDE